MNRTWSALLSGCLVFLMAGCDGGSRGSGITTAQGNVDSVQTAQRGGGSAAKPTALARLRALLPVFATAHAQAGVQGIRVFVEGTSVADETDANGFFALRGDFEGFVTIRFKRTVDGASAARWKRIVATPSNSPRSTNEPSASVSSATDVPSTNTRIPSTPACA